MCWLITLRLIYIPSLMSTSNTYIEPYFLWNIQKQTKLISLYYCEEFCRYLEIINKSCVSYLSSTHVISPYTYEQSIMTKRQVLFSIYVSYGSSILTKEGQGYVTSFIFSHMNNQLWNKGRGLRLKFKYKKRVHLISNSIGKAIQKCCECHIFNSLHSTTAPCLHINGNEAGSKSSHKFGGSN